MTEELSQPSDGAHQSRRALLKKLGAAAATGAVGSAVISSPAFADSGTVKCRFKQTAAATFVATINRPSSNYGQYQVITITNPSGSCPCGGSPTFAYAFWAQLTGTSTVTGSTGWVAFNTASSNAWLIGGNLGAFSYRLECAIRVQCNGKGATPAYFCRFGTSTGSGASSYSVPATSIGSTTATWGGWTC